MAGGLKQRASLLRSYRSLQYIGETCILKVLQQHIIERYAMYISTPSIIENLLETYVAEPLNEHTKTKHEVLYILGLHHPEEYMTQRKVALMAETYHSDDLATYTDLLDEITMTLIKRAALQTA